MRAYKIIRWTSYWNTYTMRDFYCLIAGRILTINRSGMLPLTTPARKLFEWTGFWWAIKGSNLGPTGYEPVALTNWANGPYGQPVFSWVGKHSDRILFLSTPGSNSDINTFYCVLAPPEWFEHSTPWSVATCSSAELRGHIWRLLHLVLRHRHR